MYLTLLAIGSLVLGIIGLHIFDSEGLYELSEIATIAGTIFTTVAIASIFTAHVLVDNEIYIKQIERASLVKRMEIVDSHWEDLSRSEVYREVYEWNKKVHKYKYLSENPWTNWFYSEKFCDSLRYIDLEDK